MLHDWMHRWRKALRAHRLPVTQMGGIPIHALRMMSFLAYLMLKAKKRLSTGLWRVWNNRNAVALLQRNLPDKTGEKGKWNFEKAHSILHKVREIILWGNSDNCSCQSPEVCICTWYIHGIYRYILCIL